MCAHVCECTCVRLTRCWFPQLWSNSAVTKSPCERHSASALPPTSAAFVCVCMCVCQPLPLLVPQAPRRIGSPGLVYYVNSGSRQQQAHMPQCILCAHHPDTLYLTFSNCRNEGTAEGRERSKEARWVGGVGFRDILPFGTVGRREETRDKRVRVCVLVEVHRQRRNKNRCGGVCVCVCACVRGTKACFTELNNRSPWKNAC